MADEAKFEVRAAALNAGAVVDEDDNVKAAFLLLNVETFDISFCWLPELFRTAIPGVLRAEIAHRLRMHADLLESGELEREMQKYVNINEPEKQD